MKRKVDAALKNKHTVADFFNSALQTHPNKEAIVFVDKPGKLIPHSDSSQTYSTLAHCMAIRSTRTLDKPHQDELHLRRGRS